MTGAHFIFSNRSAVKRGNRREEKERKTSGRKKEEQNEEWEGIRSEAVRELAHGGKVIQNRL